MALSVIYEASDGTLTDLAEYIRRPGFEVTEAAEEATVAQSSILVEDVGGALDIVGWKRWWAYETAEQAGNQIIASGVIGDREIGREGRDDPQVLSADRWWSVGLVDKDELLSRRLITGADGDRPQETDIARLTWLIGSDYLKNVTNTLGYIDTTSSVTLDAADLRGQSAYQVISDCANASNKNYTLVPSAESLTDGVTDYSLWYAYDYFPDYDSALKLTNVKADVDNSVTFAVEPDMVLRRTPERVYSGVLLRYLDGSIYQQKTATGNSFAFRDTTHPGINVRTASAASAKATRYLNSSDTEEDRITCTFTVPKESVNGLRAGQRVQVKFSHLPDYSSDYSWARCLRRTVRQLSDEFYQIRVELTGFGASGTATASQIRVRGPNDNNIPDPISGTFRINWDGDGEDAGPPGGCATYTRAGHFSYLGAAGERTGVQADGDGVATVSCIGTLSGVGDGVVTFTAYVAVNQVLVASDTNSTSGGLRALGWTWGVNDSFVVKEGDVIECYFTVSGDVSTLVIPSGVGNCGNFMTVTGTLR